MSVTLARPTSRPMRTLRVVATSSRLETFSIPMFARSSRRLCHHMLARFQIHLVQRRSTLLLLTTAMLGTTWGCTSPHSTRPSAIPRRAWPGYKKRKHRLQSRSPSRRHKPATDYLTYRIHRVRAPIRSRLGCGMAHVPERWDRRDDRQHRKNRL